MATSGRLDTTAKSFSVVFALRELEGATLTELATHLDLPKSTVHRHLSTLADDGFVRTDGDEYNVGFRFLELGEYARTQKEAYRLAEAPVEELAQETRERAQFVVEQHGEGSPSTSPPASTRFGPASAWAVAPRFTRRPPARSSSRTFPPCGRRRFSTASTSSR